MLYLNNPLLTSDRIISFFEKNVLVNPHSLSSNAPSPLRQLKNKLQAIFFEDLVGCDLELMSAPLEEIDVTKLAKKTPLLIKQGDEYFIYGNTDGRNWKLTKLDGELIAQSDLNFPSIDSPNTVVFYNLQYNRLYKNIQMEEGLRNLNKRPTDQNMVDVLANDNRFNENYPRLKEVLITIFSLTDYANKDDALTHLKEIRLIDMNMLGANTQFHILNTCYGYFDEQNQTDIQELLALFALLAESCRTMIVLFENNNNLDDTLAYDYAYKLMVLFIDKHDLGKIDKLFDTISKETFKLLSHSDSKKDKIFHDVLLVELQLPHASDITDGAGWKKLIKKEGKKSFYLLSMAQKIEQKIAEQEGETSLRAPKNIEEAQAISKMCRYSRTDEDPDFAFLCNKYKVSEDRFNLGLDYLASGWPKKTIDSLPDIIIQGSGDSEGFYWIKLDIADKRALILGDITKCCQSIGGDSEECVKDGVSLSDNGFYVLLQQRSGVNPEPIIDGKINDDHFDIVGQSYVWKSTMGNICLDSIECRAHIKNHIIKHIISKFATQVLRENVDIKFVNVGRGGNTPEDMFSLATISEKMKQGTLYGDAEKQYLIGETPYLYLESNQIEAMYRLLDLYRPRSELDFNQFKVCIEYLSYYKKADSISFVTCLAKILEKTPSFSSELKPSILNQFLTFKFLTIEDFVPIDLDGMDRLAQDQREAVRDNISAARLAWRVIIDPKDTLRVLKYIHKDEIIDVINALGIYRSNSTKFKYIFTELEHRDIYRLVKDKPLSFITSIFGFNLFRKYLDQEQRSLVYEKMKNKLPNMIFLPEFYNTRVDSVDEIFSPIEFMDVCSKLKQRIFSDIQSFNNVCDMLKFNNSVLRHAVIYEIIKDTLPLFINTAEEYNEIRRFLLPTETLTLYQSLQENIPGIIQPGTENVDFVKTAEDFYREIKALPEEFRKNFYEALKDQLYGFIDEYQHLDLVLREISSVERQAVCEIIKEKISLILNSVRGYTLICLNYPEVGSIIYEALQAELPGMIISIDDFNRIMQKQGSSKKWDFGIGPVLTLAQHSIVYDSVKHKLPDMIKTGIDYTKVREVLYPEQLLELDESLKDRFQDMIQSIDGLMLLEFFSLDEREALYAVVKNRLPAMMKEKYDLNNAMAYCPPDQQGDLFSATFHYLVSKLEIIASKSLVNEFVNALMNNDFYGSTNIEEIKTNFNLLIEYDNTSKSSSPRFFEDASSDCRECTNLTDVISNLEVIWLEKINSALNLQLYQGQLRDKLIFKNALNQYVTRHNMEHNALHTPSIHKTKN